MIHLSNLYELFEKDFLSDSMALTNIAKRISGNNDILILFNQSSHVAFTDGFFIYLPQTTKNDIKSAQGLVAHESGHIGYGSYELSFIKLVETLNTKYKLPKYLVKKIINVIEDVRINNLNNIKFPGFYKNLRLVTEKLLPELKDRMKRSGDLLLYINLYMEDYPGFQNKPKFRSRVMSEEDWKDISITKKFLLKSLTPASSIIAIDQLCKILKKYYRKKVIRRTPSQTPRISQGYSKELICDEHNDFDETEVNFIPEKNFEEDLIGDTSSDFIEDPCYYDESEYQSHREYNDELVEPLLNHFEDFTDKKGLMEKTELNKMSEQLVEKIENSDITIDDIKKFIDEVDSIEEKHEQKDGTNTDRNLEMNKNRNCIDPIEDIKNIDHCLISEVNGEKEIKGIIGFNEINNPMEDLEKEGYLKEFLKLVKDAQNAMKDRLFILEKGTSFQKLTEGKEDRQVKEARIEKESMKPVDLSYNNILRTYSNLITRIKFIFRDFRNQVDIDNFQKMGRLNSKFIKAITSEYKYQKCFSRKIRQKELKLLLLVDISGSMKGKKLESAKIAMIMLCEALYEIAQLRIVLFTGDYDAINILLKDFDDNPDPKKFDKFGCHANVCSNLDGVSLKHEAAKLEKGIVIIVISDGQPAGAGNYGLNNAIKEIHEVKKAFKVFAFSIDAKGDYLDQLYDKNWILTSSSNKTDLGDKLVKFCKLVVKEFFR